jgi:hypothetical protein
MFDVDVVDLYCLLRVVMQNQRAHTKTHRSTFIKSRLTSIFPGKVSSFSFYSRV